MTKHALLVSANATRCPATRPRLDSRRASASTSVSSSRQVRVSAGRGLDERDRVGGFGGSVPQQGGRRLPPARSRSEVFHTRSHADLAPMATLRPWLAAVPDRRRLARRPAGALGPRRRGAAAAAEVERALPYPQDPRGRLLRRRQHDHAGRVDLPPRPRPPPPPLLHHPRHRHRRLAAGPVPAASGVEDADHVERAPGRPRWPSSRATGSASSRRSGRRSSTRRWRTGSGPAPARSPSSTSTAGSGCGWSPRPRSRSPASSPAGSG